jgi:hypothetical protein
MPSGKANFCAAAYGCKLKGLTMFYGEAKLSDNFVQCFVVTSTSLWFETSSKDRTYNAACSASTFKAGLSNNDMQSLSLLSDTICISN